MPPAARPGHADAHFLELLALLRRQNLVDLPVRGVEFEANLRADGVHRRVDSSMVRVDDLLHLNFLLRREVQLAIEMFDNPACGELRRARRWPQPMAMEKVKAIAGDADEKPADEHRGHHQRRGRSRITRRG